MSDDTSEFMKELKKNVTEHIEMMAAAYLKETDVPIEECELVVTHTPTHTTYMFRKRNE